MWGWESRTPGTFPFYFSQTHRTKPNGWDRNTHRFEWGMTCSLGDIRTMPAVRKRAVSLLIGHLSTRLLTGGICEQGNLPEVVICQQWGIYELESPMQIGFIN